LEPLHITWHHFWQWHPLGHSHGHGHGSDGAIAIAIAMGSHGFLVSQKKDDMKDYPRHHLLHLEHHFWQWHPLGHSHGHGHGHGSDGAILAIAVGLGMEAMKR
jgi:hypothetical protein